MAGLLWVAKLLNAKPNPKAVPLVGSLGGGAWQVEHQGKAGYIWQVIGSASRGFGVSPGFYQAVIDAYTWGTGKSDISGQGGVTATVGPYVITARRDFVGEGDGAAANVVWPGGASRIAVHVRANGDMRFFFYEEDEDLHEIGGETNVDIGTPLFTMPQDPLLALTLVGLQFLARKGAGSLLEGN